MSLRIGLDIDGVIANFRAAFHDIARRCLRGRIEDPEDPKSSRALEQAEVRKVWDLVAKTPNWWVELQPYEPDQITRLYDLVRTGGWELFFLTNRPPSAGDTVQYQTQWWLERQGFYMPSVLTVPGSRGEIANALRLDIVVDDLVMNCVEVVSASTAKALLVMRQGDETARKHATDRGIGVVETFRDAVTVLERLNERLPGRRGRLLRLADWFNGPPEPGQALPSNPRTEKPAAPPRG